MKCLFGMYLQFFQKKTNEWIWLYYYDTSGLLVFVHFLEEIEDSKKTFQINWPLGSYQNVERLKGKIRKCLFFMLKYSEITVWHTVPQYICDNKLSDRYQTTVQFIWNMSKCILFFVFFPPRFFLWPLHKFWNQKWR